MERMTKHSESLGRDAQYLKTSKIQSLPYYLTVQFVRFCWKQGKQVKAKIVKPVEFPLTLDLYELCSDELKIKLEPKRKEFQEAEEKRLQEAKKQKNTDGKQEEKMEPKLTPMDQAKVELIHDSGLYELFAVLTHKGRMADSGHYVGWVKEAEDKWIKYDDDVVSYCNNEEIKKLSGKGGGDWHMAYMIVYRTKK